METIPFPTWNLPSLQQLRLLEGMVQSARTNLGTLSFTELFAGIIFSSLGLFSIGFDCVLPEDLWATIPTVKVLDLPPKYLIYGSGPPPIPDSHPLQSLVVCDHLGVAWRDVETAMAKVAERWVRGRDLRVRSLDRTQEPELEFLQVWG